jgi:hypothetical protein
MQFYIAGCLDMITWLQGDEILGENLEYVGMKDNVLHSRL